jgi:hypothetical protein
MKRIILIVLLSMALLSCSQCYECTMTTTVYFQESKEYFEFCGSMEDYRNMLVANNRSEGYYMVTTECDY